MNEQHRDDPHEDADQRDAREQRTEQHLFYQQRMAEINHLVLQAGLPPQETENAAQNAILKLLEKGPLFTEKNAARCRAWLVMVVRHEIANVIRELRRHPMLSLNALAMEPRDRRGDESPPADRETILAKLRSVLQELSERNAIDYRLVIGRHLEGHCVKELAEAEGLTVRAISCRLNRARAWLKAHLLAERGENASS